MSLYEAWFEVGRSGRRSVWLQNAQLVTDFLPLGQGVVVAVHSVTGAPNHDSQIFLLHRQVPVSWGAQQLGCEVFGAQENMGPDWIKPHSQPKELISQNRVSHLQLPELGQVKSAQQRPLITVVASHATPLGGASSLQRH